jgi:hypothetical protein
LSVKKDEAGKEAKKRSFYEKVYSIDRRYMWWGMTLLMAFILVNPLGIPMSISESTRTFAKFTDELKLGSVVLFSQDNTVTVHMAIGEGTYNAIRRLLERKNKIVFISLQQDGISTTLSTLKSIPNIDQYKYGVDYVQFGYYTGYQNVPAAMQRDVWGTLGADIKGTACKDLPIMQNLKKCTDFDAWFETGGGGEFVFYINTWSVAYQVKGTCMQTAANLPMMTTWYRNDVLNGFVNDQRGSAELSRIWGYPSKLAGILDAQSVGHLLLIALIIMGNVFYIWEKFLKRR